MTTSRAGKGDDRRPPNITRGMEELRWQLAFGPEDEKAEVLRQIEELKEKELGEIHQTPD